MRELKFKLGDDAVKIIERSRDFAKENHITFAGDEEEGEFSGNGIEGEYRIKKNTIIINYKSKPFTTFGDNAEKRLRDFFS